MLEVRAREGEGPRRCVFCHDDLRPPVVECCACRAGHHRACARERPACGTCAADLSASLGEALQPRAREEHGLLSSPIVRAALALLAVVVPVFVVFVARSVRPAPAPVRAALTDRVTIRPDDGALLTDPVVVVSGRIDGARERHGLSAHVNGVPCRVEPSGAFASARLDLQEGANVVVVRVDADGESLERHVRLIVDTAPPDVVVLEPAPTSVTIADHVRVRARVADPNLTVVLVGGRPIEAPAGEVDLVVPLGAPGQHRIVVAAVDRAGRRSEVARDVVREAPWFEVHVREPAEGAEVRGRFAVRGRLVTRSSGAELTIDGHPVAVDPDGDFSLLMDPLDPGEFAIEVRAAAGGRATTVVRRVVVVR
jgi:hypothetical protein